MKFHALLILAVLLIATFSTTLQAGGMDPDQAAQHLADRMTSKKEGDVGKVSGETLYIALGEQDGILAGSQFDIVRLGDPILVGGRQIGREEKIVAKAEAKRVRAQMTVAHQIAMLEPPRAGDKAYFTSTALKRLVVAPLLYNNMVTGLSRSLQEKLITDLLGKGMPVVERSQLEQVLSEQKLGYSGLVALDSAKKLGKLLGADAMVLGTLTDQGDTIDVNARLVALESGTALTGVQARISKTPAVSQLLGQVFEEGVGGSSSQPRQASQGGASGKAGKQPGWESDELKIEVLKFKKDAEGLSFLLKYTNKTDKWMKVGLGDQDERNIYLFDNNNNLHPFKGSNMSRGDITIPPKGPKLVAIVFKPQGNVGRHFRLFMPHDADDRRAYDPYVEIKGLTLP